MDAEPVWLTFEDVRLIHKIQIALFGGLAGVRDEGLIHSALASPKNLMEYDGVDDPLVLGIHLCAALSHNHPFTDGNKRTATVALIEFLALNGWDLVVPDDEPETPLLGMWIERLVSGTLTPGQLYDRLIHFVQERP